MRGPPLLRCACSPCSTYCESTPAVVKRRAPRTDGPLTHFASPGDEKCGLSILSLEDRTLRDIVTLARKDALNQISGVAWTLDGRHLIYSQGNSPKELWRIPLAGGQSTKTRVAMDSAGVLGLSVHPAGRQLLFHATAGSRTTAEIWVMKNFPPKLSAAR